MIRAVLVGMVLLVATLPQTATPPSGQQLPTFRTGVDVVELDVTVLDKDRHPVKGLTPADFTILDRGTPQSIVAFSAVEVPAPTSYPAPWMREAPVDVISNVENRRLVTIVMDDAYTEFNPDMTKRAKQIARTAVGELGPADLASVVFTFMGRAQNFTADHSRLLEAIESYVSKQHNGEAPLPCWSVGTRGRGMTPRPGGFGTRKCDIETLGGVAEALVTSSPGRKVVIFISGGRRLNFGGANAISDAPDLTRVFRDLQRANITVYAFDARGLMAPNMSMGNQLPDPGSGFDENESLYTFAGNTGGRTIANTNDPQAHVVEVFRESSSYYFIGFRTAPGSNDRDLHKVAVKVNRPDVQVRTRTGYYPSNNQAPARQVINGLPSGELSVYATAAVLGVPGRRDAEVIVSARIQPPSDTALPRTIELSTIAIDLDGKPRGAHRQTITSRANSESDRSPDLASHIPLGPGRYIVQLSANADGRTGSVSLDVDVPNFAKESLAASGLILQRRPAPAIADPALAALIPFKPTTIRQFRSNGDVAVFLRVYQGGKGTIAPVRMSARVKDERDAPVSNYESTLEPANFGGLRSANYEVSLPLAQLSPGEYLLEVDAQSGARHVTRTARFSVVK